MPVMKMLSQQWQDVCKKKILLRAVVYNHIILFHIEAFSHNNHINLCNVFLNIYLFLSIGKSLYVDRMFEKFQQKSSRAEHIRIRLIEPCIDVDSLIKSLSDKLEPLREQDPVFLHIDTAGVSMQTFVSLDNLFVVGST